MSSQFMKFVKVKCKYCGHLNLVPTSPKIEFPEPVKCEHCGEMIIKTDKKSQTMFFYGDTVIP